MQLHKKNLKFEKRRFFFARVSQGQENNKRVRHPIAETENKFQNRFFLPIRKLSLISLLFFFNEKKNQNLHRK